MAIILILSENASPLHHDKIAFFNGYIFRKMYTIIDEPISVGVIFSSGKISPKFFVWKGKKYPIEKITFLWDSKIGSAQIFHFAVINNGSVYEISYNLKTSNWNLDKIHGQ